MRILYTIIIPLVIGVLFYGFSPTLLDFEPQAYKVTTFESLTGALKVNSRLNDGERLFEGKIFGPESLAVHKGSIYTGTGDGCITKITGNAVICLTKIKEDCEKAPCSRPLGVRFNKAGTLYVADGILGIFSVDVSTGSVTPLLFTEELVGGKPVTLPDDLDITSDGKIYFCDTSVRWKIGDIGLSIIEHENSGRIIQFDTTTNKSTVIVDGIYVPGGVQLSKSEDALLISEFSNNRVLKHHLKGEKKGQTEVFVDVPGAPDNIRPSKNGYWITIFSYNYPANTMERLSEYPFVRKVIVRFQRSIASLLLFINHYCHCERLENFAHGWQSGFGWLIPSVVHGMAIEVDENGKFIQSVHSPDGKNGAFSEILEYDGYLYAGSYLNSYIVKTKA